MAEVWSDKYWTGGYTYTRVKVVYSGESATAILCHSRTNNWKNSSNAEYNHGGTFSFGGSSVQIWKDLSGMKHEDVEVARVSFSISMNGGTYSGTAKTPGGDIAGTTAFDGSVAVPAQVYWNDINAYQPNGSTQNGLMFDLTTSVGDSWTNLTNEPSDFSRAGGTSATISNIRSNVTGAHYTRNNITNTNAASFTWTFSTAGYVVELFSAWDTYDVIYNANGGVGAPAQQTKTYNVNLALSSTVPTMSSSLQPGYTVYFNANGGTCAVSSFTTSNYLMHSFEEWNTAQDGSGTTYYPSGTYTANAPLRLYAQWNTHTEPGGVTLPTPTKTGCNFLGWSRSLTEIEYVQDGYIPYDNETLYAIYQQSEKIYTTSTLLDGLEIQSVAASDITPFSFTITAVATLPIVRDIAYGFSIDGGSTWTDYQASNTYSFTGLTEETTYLVMVRAKAVHQGIDAQDDIAYTATPTSVTTLVDQARVWIKRNGVWVRGKVFIKVNGQWKKAKKLYIKKDGQWRLNKNN